MRCHTKFAKISALFFKILALRDQKNCFIDCWSSKETRCQVRDQRGKLALEQSTTIYQKQYKF